MKETNLKSDDPALVELAQLRNRLQNAEDTLEDLVEKLKKRDAELKEMHLKDPEYSELLKKHEEKMKEHHDLMGEFSSKIDNLISIAEVTNEQPKEQE